jgi:hypothetical protein
MERGEVVLSPTGSRQNGHFDAEIVEALSQPFGTHDAFIALTVDIAERNGWARRWSPSRCGYH